MACSLVSCGAYPQGQAAGRAVEMYGRGSTSCSRRFFVRKCDQGSKICCPVIAAQPHLLRSLCRVSTYFKFGFGFSNAASELLFLRVEELEKKLRCNATCFLVGAVLDKLVACLGMGGGDVCHPLRLWRPLFRKW